ncbi:hypothetical protein L1987_43598 [Smallanthus sonchifolius]|uniref:Uncharacterized protein n=1 Tax=Smallanthus sonchifolius TaxID=185202 RepID=A0ACB9GLX9_9ASTR|nr:hypothetical protein L1987_43598 [Smallanthus sonchifolius]
MVGHGVGDVILEGVLKLLSSLNWFVCLGRAIGVISIFMDMGLNESDRFMVHEVRKHINRGVDDPTTLCSMHGSCTEFLDHVFASCPVSLKIWQCIEVWLDIAFPLARDP